MPTSSHTVPSLAPTCQHLGSVQGFAALLRPRNQWFYTETQAGPPQLFPQPEVKECGALAPSTDGPGGTIND